MGRGRPIHGVALPIPWPNERVKCRIRPLHERFRPVAAVRRDELRREKNGGNLRFLRLREIKLQKTR